MQRALDACLVGEVGLLEEGGCASEEGGAGEDYGGLEGGTLGGCVCCQ